MDVDEKLVKKVAGLARLELTETEVKTFTPQLQEILTFFEALEKADVSDDPLFLPIDLKNVLREDKIEEGLSQEDALKNTPHKKDGYFKGPRAV